MPPQTFFKFFVGQEPLWMNIHEIHLVVPVEDFSAVPRTPPVIKGILEVEGKIATLVDLNALFGTGSNGSLPFHAALLNHPSCHMAICLYSEFDVVGIQENISFTAIAETDPIHALGIKKRLNIQSASYPFLEADELIHLCENLIREHVKKNLLMTSAGE